MTMLRRTFVVHVHADRTAILEDVRAGDRLRLGLGELPAEIERRLDPLLHDQSVAHRVLGDDAGIHELE